MKLNEQAKAELKWALDNCARAYEMYQWGVFRAQKWNIPFESGFCQAAYDHLVRKCKEHNIPQGKAREYIS